MEQFHSDVARQEQCQFLRESRAFLLTQHHIFCSINYTLLFSIVIYLVSCFDCRKVIITVISFLLYTQRAFWIHQMACFAQADSASCLHCNSAWDVLRSRDVIEGLASCTLHSTIPPTHINLYKSAVVFAAGEPPSSLKLGQGTPVVSGKCAHRGSCTRM